MNLPAKTRIRQERFYRADGLLDYVHQYVNNELEGIKLYRYRFD